eukprot:TRINITY_DN27361_c0_g1_i3.p1 TRINITY_DN27361_c0_g1~~TRINITY_DN27361_c0_g1_i3.p1  ORF type:complete len:499 (-),score=80.16 TRINITY_DN27361_c0_g1_i3:207-1703(-)
MATTLLAVFARLFFATWLALSWIGVASLGNACTDGACMQDEGEESWLVQLRARGHGVGRAGNVTFPLEQTENQKTIWKTMAAKAKAASEAATPEVLAFFASKGFRDGIKDCCPELLSLSAEQMLARFRQEVQATEIVHAFPSVLTPGLKFIDVTIADLAQYPWFLNEWQAKLLANAGPQKGPQSEAEEDLFGCYPFRGDIPTWEEASDRLIYAAHNMRQMDTGSCPWYGDVAAVFSNRYAKKMILISPTDSGFYTNACIEKKWEPEYLLFNCSAWNPTIAGTLDHFDHLILPNLGAMEFRTPSAEAPDLFKRSIFNTAGYEKLPSLSWLGMGRYMEPNILGNPALPEGVRFLIGNLPQVFGTPSGKKLQELCKQRSWPLLWALGTSGRGFVQPQFEFAMNNRILDPENAKLLTDAVITDEAIEQFNDLWQTVESARAKAEPKARQWHSWWKQLEQIQTRVGPIGALTCADTERCIAIDGSNNKCICKHSVSTSAPSPP